MDISEPSSNISKDWKYNNNITKNRSYLVHNVKNPPNMSTTAPSNADQKKSYVLSLCPCSHQSFAKIKRFCLYTTRRIDTNYNPDRAFSREVRRLIVFVSIRFACIIWKPLYLKSSFTSASLSPSLASTIHTKPTLTKRDLFPLCLFRGEEDGYLIMKGRLIFEKFGWFLERESRFHFWKEEWENVVIKSM